MIVRYTPDVGEPLTQEMRQEIEEAAKRPIVFDEDCPEMDDDLLKAMRCAAVSRNRHMQRA